MKFKIILGLFIVIFSVSIFAEGPLTTYWKNYDGKAERASRLKTATEYGKNLQASQQKTMDDARSKIQQQIQEAARVAAHNQRQRQQAGKDKSKPQKPQSLTTCDCYNETSPYNYPKNFTYNADKERVTRIFPACSCQPTKTGVTTNTSTTSNTQGTESAQPAGVVQGTTSQKPVVGSTGVSQGGSSDSSWKIDYN